MTDVVAVADVIPIVIDSLYEPGAMYTVSPDAIPVEPKALAMVCQASPEVEPSPVFALLPSGRT